MTTQYTNNSVVAVYKTHLEAEVAIKDLQKSGFDMKKLSIIGRDVQTDDKVIGYFNTGDRMKYWGELGLFWGWVWGLLFGSAVLFIPGVGPIVAGGPIVVWIMGALENAVILGGISALGAGLVSQGLPKDSVLKYETEIKNGKYILIANGSEEEAKTARDVIAHSKSESIDHHNDLTDGSPLTTVLF